MTVIVAPVMAPWARPRVRARTRVKVRLPAFRSDGWVAGTVTGAIGGGLVLRIVLDIDGRFLLAVVALGLVLVVWAWVRSSAWVRYVRTALS